jgi:hypothetical protein
MRVACLFFAACFAVGPLAAQFPPDSVVNLQVLPKDMPVRDVIATMRTFTFALGVRCDYCHIGADGEPPAEFDFVSDDMPAKVKAREMMRMAGAINDDWLAALPRRGTPGVHVECVTCHRGQARPILMDDLLAAIVDSAGAGAAVARWRELRERFYGGATYDFRAGPVAAAAVRLLRSGNPAAADTLLRLNAEFYPDDAPSAFLASQVALAIGDTAAAIEALVRAAALQSDNPLIQRLLEQLTRRRDQ